MFLLDATGGILFSGCPLEMGRSAANADVWPKNSAECLARFGSASLAELPQKFGFICGFAFAVYLHSPMMLT